MNQSDSVVRTQVDALLELLEQSRSARCREVLEQATVQCADIRQRARQLARERVSKAAREERQRMEHELRMVEAEINTERRRRERARDLALIAAGRQLLGDALAARWRDAAGRRDWTETALGDASAVLLDRAWTLEHPADWPQAEGAHAATFAQERYGATLQPEPADGLEIGLRVKSEGALVDMSIAGLMASERSIEGELLAEFNQPAAGDTS
jgi:hypothetical protein